MFGIFKKIFGASNSADDGRSHEPPPQPATSYPRKAEGGDNSSQGAAFGDMQADIDRMSTQMPGGDYFNLLTKLQAAISDKNYRAAADAANKSLPLLRKWLKDPRGDDERLSISIPVLSQGGTMMAITGDRKGLEAVHTLVNEFDHLDEYCAVAEKHFQDMDLFENIRALVAAKPGVLQNKMKTELGATDGRQVSNLISWLEKAGEITRAKSGKTYALYMADAKMTQADAAAVYTEPPRPGSHRQERRSGRAQEIELNALDLVPLPPSPTNWSNSTELPATTETFADPDERWREMTVQPIPATERPDPAFRKHFTTRDGILSFDDLAKSEDSHGAGGAVMFTPEMEGEAFIKPLARRPYEMDIHPEGLGFAIRTKGNLLTVYNEKLEMDFETDLEVAPEVVANRKRFDLDGEGKHRMLWGEPHLALNCIALSPTRDRYLFTHVDEAWCIDRGGKRLWGIRMPECPIETYTRNLSVEEFGMASDIEDALSVFDLEMPVTPKEIREQYRKLVRELHPDIHPGQEDRMKAVNVAYKSLTGVSPANLEGSGRAEDLLRLSATITTGGGPDRIQSAAFSGNGETVLLGTSEGRVIRIDREGKPITLYEVGSAPIRILETDRYLYIQTFTRLYVLDGDRLVALQDCTTKCDLLVDEGMVLLVENKGVRVFTEAGGAIGVILTKAPIRRTGIEHGDLVIATRTHRGRFSDLVTATFQNP